MTPLNGTLASRGVKGPSIISITYSGKDVNVPVEW